jgi:hypothetical protein
MWSHRIAGMLSALTGCAVMSWLQALFYAPIPGAEDTLIALGMPGVLLTALAAILAICFGAPFALAPRFAARRVARLTHA